MAAWRTRRPVPPPKHWPLVSFRAPEGPQESWVEACFFLSGVLSKATRHPAFFARKTPWKNWPEVCAARHWCPSVLPTMTADKGTPLPNQGQNPLGLGIYWAGICTSVPSLCLNCYTQFSLCLNCSPAHTHHATTVSGCQEQNLDRVFLEWKGQEATENRPLDPSRIHMLRTSHCKVICLTRKLLSVSTTKPDPSGNSHHPLVRGLGVGGPSVAGGRVPNDSLSWQNKKHSQETRRNIAFLFQKLANWALWWKRYFLKEQDFVLFSVIKR